MGMGTWRARVSLTALPISPVVRPARPTAKDSFSDPSSAFCHAARDDQLDFGRWIGAYRRARHPIGGGNGVRVAWFGATERRIHRELMRRCQELGITDHFNPSIQDALANIAAAKNSAHWKQGHDRRAQCDLA